MAITKTWKLIDERDLSDGYVTKAPTGKGFQILKRKQELY